MQLPLQQQFNQGFSDSQALLHCFKKSLALVSEQQLEAFEQEQDIYQLILERSQAVDALLRYAWQFFLPKSCALSLVAVGGFGRQELLPHSDIDLLILGTEQSLNEHEQSLKDLITFLWDSRLNIGHSVRTVAQTIEYAQQDITVVTNLMESRHIIGEPTLHQSLLPEITPEKIWPSKDFFQAKWQEQITRHKKFNNTEYNLEPNVKTCPGGLRDIQMIGWIAKRHFSVNCLEELVENGFLTLDEYQSIRQGQAFLLKVRFALHSITGREEDRLLFDHQSRIAKYFGYQKDAAGNLAIEQLMKQYFRWALTLSELNDMIMQLFDENILRACEAEDIMHLNPRFRVRNNFIEATNDRVFSQTPQALMEIFLLMAQHGAIEGVRAQTIRLIREHRHLIDDAFRNDERNQQFFLDILRAPKKVGSSIKFMKRYGILGKYIPAFGEIIGQSQHDLFHIYTVDAHTILVLENACAFSNEHEREQNPIAAQVVKRMEKKELLYLACLFHDIAKGRGGDHSTLGAEDAYSFCRKHGYNLRDSNLVAWLVKNHLLMSFTAQKKDISDPDVIRKFALKMGEQKRLDYLFALTVADINGTNPTLWNSWRASLLRQLYYETKRALRRGLEVVIDKQELIEETQAQALQKLLQKGGQGDAALSLWKRIDDDYFMREAPLDIVWQTLAITQHAGNDNALIISREANDLIFHGATQIFIYSRKREHSFALVTQILEQLQLNIVDARMYTTDNDYLIENFLVLDSQGEPLAAKDERLKSIEYALKTELTENKPYQDYSKQRTPRQLKFFKMKTGTSFSHDPVKNISALEVITADRPGLLAIIAEVFVEFSVLLSNAKISTLGEKVEDVFFITDKDNNYLSDAKLCQDIESTIRLRLDEQIAESS